MYKNIRQQPQFKTLIYEGELDRIAGWVEEYPNLETGGDLFGFWTHTGAPVIQFVLGPGETSRHNPASFYQDKDYLVKAGEILRNKHGLQHIGEWHSHHQMGLAKPSGGDENTVFRALERYSFPRFLLCIANLRSGTANSNVPRTDQNFDHYHSGHSSLEKPRSSTEVPLNGRRRDWIINIGSFLFTHSKPRYQVGAWVVLPGNSPIGSSLRREKKFFNSPSLSKKWDVKETTLDAEVLEPTQQIEISKGLWYAKPEGLVLLREIDTEFKQQFSNCQMCRTPSEQIYFTFKKGQDIWKIELPDDFPYSSPLFRVNERQVNIDSEWTPDSKLLEVFLKYYHDHYSPLPQENCPEKTVPVHQNSQPTVVIAEDNTSFF